MAASGSLDKAESNSNTRKRVKLHLDCVYFVFMLIFPQQYTARIVITLGFNFIKDMKIKAF